MKEQLRFAIMINGPFLAVWQWECIREMIRANVAQPVLLIVNAGNESNPNLGKKISGYPYRQFFYRAWKRFFLKVPAQDYISLPPALSGLPQLNCTTRKKGKYSEYFEESDLEKIREEKLDFILRFGFNIIRGPIHVASKYGTWSFHHGDERTFRGGPAGFWEIFRRSPVNGVILQRLNDRIDAGIVLDRRNYQTVLHSYREHLQKILSHSTDMPALVCKKILSGDVALFEQPHSSTDARMNRVPRNFQMLVFLLKLQFNRFRFHWNRLFRQEKWDILVFSATNPGASLKDLFKVERFWWQKLSGKGWYGADPFTFTSHGRHFLVYERYDYRVGKGKIHLAELDEHLKPVSDRMILDSETHLAYPYIFRDGEHVYMVPETAEEGNVKLYRWNFSGRTFEFHRIILEQPGVDSSLLFYEDKWWLFCGLKGQLPNEKLFLFCSGSLEGPYIPHLLNPVKVDAEGSRMGGNFLTRGKDLYRPGQYSRKWYGEKIRWWKIRQITLQRYVEESGGECAPAADWPFAEGLHTVSNDKDIFAVDAKKRKSDLVSLMAALRNK